MTGGSVQASSSMAKEESSKRHMEEEPPETKASKPGPWPPKNIEPFRPPNQDLNPRDLKTWAKRTGFNFSGEATSSRSIAGGEIHERGLDNGAASRQQFEIEAVYRGVLASSGNVDKGRVSDQVVRDLRTGRVKDQVVVEVRRGGGRQMEEDVQPTAAAPATMPAKVLPVGNNVAGAVNGGNKDENGGDMDHVIAAEGLERFEESADGEFPAMRKPGMMTEKPNIAAGFYFGLQHYLSMAGSIVFIPLIIAPAMGGTDEDTAHLISTMLLVTGITTLIHSYFGTRLPLVQGSSFVYLAPALAIANSQEFRNLSDNKFRHIMKEMQGAIIVGSIFQSFIGYSGIMALLIRLINPVVVAPTVAAVGLAFFSYGFAQAGQCIEISMPQILLIVIFTLYLRRVSIFGHRVFQVYAVSLSVAVTWVYASLMTAGGAYNFKGCNLNIPSSNIIQDGCRKHALVMKHCRTDASNAWSSAAWVRIPYPFQWGLPSFHLRTCFIMIIVSLIASVDSVGSYHAASLLLYSKPLTPGIVSRGIGIEGLTSILAGLWGTTAGSTTLTENVHTIAITKTGNRLPVQIGAVLLILFSFVGKIGAIITSIPQAMAASVLCFMWAMLVAMGLSTLRYSETSSSRNVMIVGLALFLGVSVPAYVQQYSPNISIILPSYLVPYAALSDGPIQTGSPELNFALNGLLSLPMVVAFLVAFILDNSVPGSKQERGVYIWGRRDELRADPFLMSVYALPRRITRFFGCVKCIGT